MFKSRLPAARKCPSDMSINVFPPIPLHLLNRKYLQLAEWYATPISKVPWPPEVVD
jgi:hypothetical protein